MIENNPTNVSAAFEILLEEVETEIDFIDRIGAKAFGSVTHGCPQYSMQSFA